MNPLPPSQNDRLTLRRLWPAIAGVLVFGLLMGGLLIISGMRLTTSWETLEARLPAAIQAAGLELIEERSEGSNRVPLSQAWCFVQSLVPHQRAIGVGGFPEQVLHYTIEARQGQSRLHCLVRYHEGMVARIVVEYPQRARNDALHLRDSLRRSLPKDGISHLVTSRHHCDCSLPFHALLRCSDAWLPPLTFAAFLNSPIVDWAKSGTTRGRRCSLMCHGLGRSGVGKALHSS